MLGRYLEIRYEDGSVERLPIRRHEDINAALRGRQAVSDYIVRSAWWYRPVTWLGIQLDWLRPRKKGKYA